MQTVDKSVRFVELSPQRRLVAAIVGRCANRCAMDTAFRRFNFP
jgi:hypothetical protein